MWSVTTPFGDVILSTIYASWSGISDWDKFFMVKENSNILPMYTQNNINALLIEFTAELLNNTQPNT